MVIHDLGKLMVLAIVSAGLIAILVLGTVEDTDAVWTLLGAIIGYLTGNGLLAHRREQQSPLIGHRTPPTKED